MTFDTNTLLIVLAVVAVLILAFLVMRRRRGAERIERKSEEPYVASQERPYMTTRVQDGPQGNSLADEIATATTDVAGDVLGANASDHLPGGPAHQDDFTRLKGVGQKFAMRLNELGIYRYDQLASFGENELSELDQKLGPFRGRLSRDRLSEQADHLARNDVDGFEQKFGKLTH